MRSPSIIVIGDGMADRPVAALGDQTPLEAAQTPNLDRVARQGRLGTFDSIPLGQPLGSAVANLSVLGYSPERHFAGRAVLEAAAMGVELEPDDVALRLNFIALQSRELQIRNHSAGHLSTAEAAPLLDALRAELNGPGAMSLHLGVGYRHLLVLRGGWGHPGVDCAPPHDHVGEAVEDLLPRASLPQAQETALALRQLIETSRKVLAGHPINLERRAAGQDCADSVWPWSPGRRSEMKTLEQRYGVRGAVISAVDLVRGMGRYAGLEVLRVEGATGLWDTNYEGKVAAALDALERLDFVYLHVEAPDEAGHARDAALKVRCIEDLDRRVIGPLLDGARRRALDLRLAVLPDHPTPVETGKHAREPVPVALWGRGLRPDSATHYSEAAALSGGLGALRGEALIEAVLGA